MGSCPDWYGLISAAKYIGVAPWVLQEQSMTWVHLIRAHEDAVAEATNTLESNRARREKNMAKVRGR